MAVYLSNAFSLSMLPLENERLTIIVEKVSPEEVPDAISIVGHADIAQILSNLLGRKVPYNRVSTKLQNSDIVYVAQYMGPRLPEGTTQLPPGAEIQFLKVSIV